VTNAANERIKRDYFRYLREALGRDEATIVAVARKRPRLPRTWTMCAGIPMRESRRSFNPRCPRRTFAGAL
jgi:hypothetical protein